MRVTSRESSCHRSYMFWRKGLNDLSFDSRSSKSGSIKRERKCDLCMPLFLMFTFSLVFFLIFLLLFSFVFSCIPLSFFSTSCIPPPLLFMAIPFYTICHCGIYPFCPLTVFVSLWASLQDCPLACQLSSHYLYPECAGCTTLHFQTKLLVLFLISLCSCFTHMDKD